MSPPCWISLPPPAHSNASRLLQRPNLSSLRNPGLPHCGQILYHLSHQEIPYCSPKTSILWRSAFFMVQLSHPYRSVQFSSVAQSCPTLCEPMNRSMLGLPVHHKLPEFAQTHVHLVGDAIQSSHPLSSPSLPAPNPSQYQGLCQWVNSLHEVAKVLEFQLQHQSFQWALRTDLL